MVNHVYLKKAVEKGGDNSACNDRLLLLLILCFGKIPEAVYTISECKHANIHCPNLPKILKINL